MGDDQLDADAARLAALEAELADLRTRLGDQRTALDGHAAWLADLQSWMTATVQTVASISTRPPTSSPTLQRGEAQLIDPLTAIQRQLQVWTVMAWISQLELTDGPRISVVTPTHNRRRWLERAVQSVFSQTYTNWELVVVDDSSDDDTPEWLSTMTDARVRTLHTTARAAGRARNVALEVATGEVIAYLDDDNLMHRDWLKAVAWAFSRWPDTEFLYGARIIEDALTDPTPGGALPILEFLPFDRGRLEQANYIDMNVQAHRAGLRDARFDPHISAGADWDMALRMTGRQPPLELPAIACTYTSSSPNRVSETVGTVPSIRSVRSRIHTTRPMRVLTHTALFPLVSETYIDDETRALRNQGATIAFSRALISASPITVDAPVFDDVVVAVKQFDPDVILVYWADHALGELEKLGDIGVPFGLRVHSYDFRPPVIKQIQDHPLCVGVWAFPHHARSLPGAHELVPLFTSRDQLAPAAGVREAVVSVSAGLPKKDWPTLLDAFSALPDVERHIVVARTNGFESLPDDLARQCQNLQPPPTLTVNMERDEVFRLLARSAALIYTLGPGEPFGMPMSLVEAMCSGVSVIGPDRPEVWEVVGPGLHPYETAVDIVQRVREILVGGPDVEAARLANRHRAWALFCDPAAEERFHRELSRALTEWRVRQV